MIFFVQETEVCNFVDNTTMYSYSLDYTEAAHKRSNVTYIFLILLKVNSVVGNPDKFQIMFLGSKIDNSKNIQQDYICNRKQVNKMPKRS